MKILKVSFKNLNSLRGEHLIDLDAGPLSQAGIFAITGPTGAGKSTILDAITLALYGRAARYGNVSSPEDMMSRHTGECQADVVFSVKGVKFRASWHLWRARGRVDGQLQKPERRIFDAAGKTLAQKIGEADTLIESLTGLNYDRFLRSVLLAQGEFSRFLKADANERADLLEQLTGTDIYSRLSIKANEETSHRESALAQEESARAAITLLSEEERREKTREIARLGDEHTAGVRAQDAMTERLSLGRQLQERLEERQRLPARRNEISVKRASAGPDFARLERHNQTQPFCADFARLDAHAVRAEDERRLWDEARLVTQDTTRTLTNARGAARFLATLEVTAREQELTRRREEEKRASAQQEMARTWLERHSAESALETALVRIGEKLTLLAEACRRQDSLLVGGRALLAKETSLREQVIATESVLALASAEKAERLAASEAVAGELSAALGGRLPDDFRSDLSRLHERKELLTHFCTLLQKSVDAADKEKLLAEAEEVLVQELPGHRERAESAGSVVTLRGEVVDALRDHLAGAKFLAGFDEHRTRLKPGEACPLCGSMEHPFSVSSAERPSDIDSINEKLLRGRKDLKTAELDHQTKLEILARVSTRHRSTQEQREAAQREHVLARQTFIAQANKHGLAHADLREFQMGIDRAAEAIKRVEEQNSAIQQLQSRHDAVKGAYNDLRVETGKLEENLRASRTALGLATHELATNAAEASGHEDIVGGLSLETARLLEPLAAIVPVAGEEATLLRALEVRREEYARQLTSAREIAAKLQEIRHGTSQAEAEWQRAVQQLAEFPALDSEEAADTGQVSRLVQEWSNLNIARTRVQTFMSSQTTSLVRESALLSRCQEVRRFVEADTAALNARLAGAPGLFSDLDDLRSARLSDETAAGIERNRRLLDEEESRLDGQHQQLEQDTADLRARQAPEGEALAILEAARQEQQARNDELAAQRVRREEEIRHDDANRILQAQRATVIEQALVQLKYWRRLRELIGSHDGRKFRRFAQGLSLDLLVRHANRHLAQLSNRYRLHRVEGEELNLEIIDADQAGSKRPMASLSGGESFLTSLALALGLSDLAGRNVRIDSLFVDEGFGSLDADTLDIAVAALESLRTSHKTIGIISHVELLKERISAQIRVEKRPGGVSKITITG